MAYGILPPCRSMLKIGEVIQDPRVDVLNWQLLMRRVLDGHEDEAGEGVGRLAVDVFLRVVGNMRRMGLVDVVPTQHVTILLLIILTVLISTGDVLQQVAVL